MMDDYLILVDTCESEDIDEAALRANHVAGLIVRLNHTEDGHHLNTNFTRQWQETSFAGLVRIPYFVYNPWADAQTNFNWLVDAMPFEAGAVLLAVDVEYEGYPPEEYAGQVARFCQWVGARWRYMLYTGQNRLQLLSEWLPAAEYWWAQYPYSLYPSTPQKRTWAEVREQIAKLHQPFNAACIPGPWRLWQVSADRLLLPGSSRPMNINLFPGSYEELKDWVHEQPEPVDAFVEEHTRPYPGVEYHRVRRFHSHCHALVIDPKGKRFTVTKYGLKTISTAARELGAQIVVNGGDFNAEQAVGLHASEGRVFQTVEGYQPWVNFTRGNEAQINSFNSKETKYNALAGKRFIVLDGKISAGTSQAWRDVHPRTLAGVTPDGKLILCVVDGRQGPNNNGVDLFDAARIMLEFGASKAIDLDGGGSSAMWLQGRIVNSPIDNGLPGHERAVGTHIALFISE